MSLVPRVVLVTRRTEYQDLLARHGTRGQAAFFLKSRGQDLREVEEWHLRFEEARGQVLRVIPGPWRRSTVDRDDLDRFVFEPGDVVVALGQDGLVANVAKYLDGQIVIGVNPEPARLAGILVPHAAGAAGALITTAGEGKAAAVEERTMVEAATDDGQVLRALNEVFVGHRTHQSARYRIGVAEVMERQSSSGVIVSTGTGATGWTSSIVRQRQCDLALPAPTDPRLAFFVREAWPSISTGTGLTEGVLGPGDSLRVVSEMGDAGVVFGDGMEGDALPFGWGRVLTVRRSQVRLNLLTAA